METKDETKELNLCELLQGYEKSFFVSPCYGQVELKEIKCNRLIIQDMETTKHTLNHDRTHFPCRGVCIIYPSKELYQQYPLDPYTAWMKWKEQEKCKIYVCVKRAPCIDDVLTDGLLHFRTLSDRDKAIEEIKAIIEKYSKE